MGHEIILAIVAKISFALQIEFSCFVVGSWRGDDG